MTRNAFKQTEVGAIPVEWDLQPYGEVFDILSTATFSRADLSENGEVSYVHYGDVHTKINHFLDPNTVLLPTVSIDKAIGYPFLKDGDLIMVDASEDLAGVSKSVEVKNLANRNVISGLHTFLLRDRNGVFVDGFRAYITSIPIVAEQMATYATGIKVYGVSKSNLKRIQIPVPPKDEQQSIAEALQAVDLLITSLDRLIAKKRYLKNGTMHELVSGTRRLTGFTSKWETLPLSDLVSLERDFVNPKSLDETVPCLELEHLGQESGRLLGYGNPRSQASLKAKFRKGDVLFGKLRPYLKKYFYPQFDGVCSSEIWVLRALTPAVGAFIYYLIQSAKFVEAANQTTGTKMPRAEWQTVSSTVFSIPPTFDEQEAISRVLSDMDSEIEFLERQRDKHSFLKQGMMQDLLTGRIRLQQKVSNVAPIRSSPTKAQTQAGHNQHFNEAVVLSVLTGKFASIQYPLARKRRNKLAYLLHRHSEGKAEGFLKKAAGPYSPTTRYGGAEKIAVKNKYVREHGHGFIAGENIDKAKEYFDSWYGTDAYTWLEQFHYVTNDKLELLATVDMAMVDLREVQSEISVSSVKSVINSSPEWKPKLTRSIFSDANIADAIQWSERLFGQDNG